MQPYCEIIASTNHGHVQQIYTGLSMLARQDQIVLSQSFDLSSLPETASPAHLTLFINQSIRAVFDVVDSPAIDGAHLQSADVYFKRSYWPDVVAALGDEGRKIHPLGLNYKVIPNTIDLLGAKRGLRFGSPMERLRSVAKALLLYPGFSERESLLHDEPTKPRDPGVLFMVRAWDPHDDPSRSSERVELRKTINETRAKCIDALRRNFGKRFQGGFAHSEYAKAHYGPLLLPTQNLATKRNYLSLLRSHSICIATMGLHKSIGWKFAEYVAFSKAIVSEPLDAVVPPPFSKGKNYLEFTGVDDCVGAVDLLMTNPVKRHEMMRENHDYYTHHMRPDLLVNRAIQICLGKA